jgi:hypothetical protein
VHAARAKELFSPYVAPLPLKLTPGGKGSVGALPVFATDYTAVEETTMVSNTNGAVLGLK